MGTWSPSTFFAAMDPPGAPPVPSAYGRPMLPIAARDPATPGFWCRPSTWGEDGYYWETEGGGFGWYVMPVRPKGFSDTDSVLPGVSGILDTGPFQAILPYRVAVPSMQAYHPYFYAIPHRGGDSWYHLVGQIPTTCLVEVTSILSTSRTGKVVSNPSVGSRSYVSDTEVDINIHATSGDNEYLVPQFQVGDLVPCMWVLAGYSWQLYDLTPRVAMADSETSVPANHYQVKAINGVAYFHDVDT